jgi:hypothetical protein
VYTSRQKKPKRGNVEPPKTVLLLLLAQYKYIYMNNKDSFRALVVKCFRFFPG